MFKNIDPSRFISEIEYDRDTSMKFRIIIYSCKSEDRLSSRTRKLMFYETCCKRYCLDLEFFLEAMFDWVTRGKVYDIYFFLILSEITMMVPR